MIKKIPVLLMICIMAISLVLTSCGDDTTPTVQTDNGDETVVIKDNTESTESTDPTEKPVDKIPENTDDPQHGGVIVLATAYNWQDFDEVVGSPITFNHPMRLVNQELWIGDWSRGPAGTQETDFGASRVMLYKTGDLAESWEFSGWDAGELIFNIREGVHWALDANSEASRLVNGREVTAEDVAFSLKQVCTNPSAYIYKAYPMLREAEITAVDKYTFKVKAAVPTSLWFLRIIDFYHIVPQEVVEKYGDMSDWKNSVGSGPFMIKDFVDNSSMTFIKNETYWATNTAEGPGYGDQLPYVDSVRFLTIADLNTRQSAFRTGHVDTVSSSDWQDGPSLIKDLPDINHQQNAAYGAAGNTAMRTDKEPFNDIRVRKAMFKAIDFNKISRALYGEGSRFLAWPIGYSSAYEDAYLDLDDPDCPDEVIDIYTYDPEAAKQLLAEAGHSDGLKGDVIVLNSAATLDYYQTLQAYWAAIGVDVSLDTREQGAWYTILQARNYDFMMYGSASPITNLHTCSSMMGDQSSNPSYIDDPKIAEAKEKMMPLSIVDDPAADAIHRELMKYVLAQAWVIPMPGGVNYDLWWPWIKSYYGDLSLGYMNTDNWVIWAWVDTSLKKEMGY